MVFNLVANLKNVWRLKMTNSEKICNEIGVKFFCKDYVYEDLRYFNDANYKVELCDGLFEYADFYVALQIKERSKEKTSRSNEDWLNDKVYTDASEQIDETYKAIKTNNIMVHDLYHQPVKINKSYDIIPIVIFDNPEIKEYKKVIISKENNLKINVFSIEDYSRIISYLDARIKLLGESDSYPSIIMGDNRNSSIIAKIETEEDVCSFYTSYIYDGDVYKKKDGIIILKIIEDYRKRQIKKDENYKVILKILQNIKPQQACYFVERFEYALHKALARTYDHSKSLMLVKEEKKIAIVFLSVGEEDFANFKVYEMICLAKQQQYKVDEILLISFLKENERNCRIDWTYFEKPYELDEELLNGFMEQGLIPNIKKI